MSVSVWHAPEPDRSRITRILLLAGVMLVAGAIATLIQVLLAPSARADSGGGFIGPSYAGTLQTAPTGEKPESKAWFAGGSWWAAMISPSTGGYQIFRLNRAAEQWESTGVPLDSRGNTRSDALWNGTHLFVASHVFASSSSTVQSNKPARLFRYSLVSGGWRLDPGFPVTISNYSAEALTVDQDSTGRVWATFTRAKRVYVVATKGSADSASVSFGSPFIPSVPGTSVTSDDISAVASANGQTMIMWGNQTNGTYYSAFHADGAAVTDWIGRTALSGSLMADDHINLKAIPGDPLRRFFAVVKTSRSDVTPPTASDPLVELLVYSSTGGWRSHVVGQVADFHTRPILLLSPSDNRVMVYLTGPNTAGKLAYEGTIYEKSAALDNPVFATGLGTPVIRDSTSATVNNASSTKQTVDSSMGAVVLASSSATLRYYFADLPLSGPTPSPAPVAAFSMSPSSGVAPLSVSFTDLSTGSPTSWAWNFGDGSGATAQNPTHLYTAPGTYQVTLTVSSPGGSSSSSKALVVTASSTSPTVVARVNVGGPALPGGWTADTSTSVSPWVNAAAAQTGLSSTSATIDLSDSSIPSGTPAALFQTGRYDGPYGAEMTWTIPVPQPGSYLVRLYFAETYAPTEAVGARVFNVVSGAVPELTRFDVFAAVGAKRAVEREFTVTTTTNTVSVTFQHVVENPLVRGIEVLSS